MKVLRFYLVSVLLLGCQEKANVVGKITSDKTPITLSTKEIALITKLNIRSFKHQKEVFTIYFQLQKTLNK